MAVAACRSRCRALTWLREASTCRLSAYLVCVWLRTRDDSKCCLRAVRRLATQRTRRCRNWKCTIFVRVLPPVPLHVPSLTFDMLLPCRCVARSIRRDQRGLGLGPSCLNICAQQPHRTLSAPSLQNAAWVCCAAKFRSCKTCGTVGVLSQRRRRHLCAWAAAELQHRGSRPIVSCMLSVQLIFYERVCCVSCECWRYVMRVGQLDLQHGVGSGWRCVLPGRGFRLLGHRAKRVFQCLILRRCLRVAACLD